MTAVLVHVPVAALASVLPAVHPHLERIADGSSGKYGVGDLLQAIAADVMQLWAVLDEDRVLAAGLTELRLFPGRKVCRAVACAGSDSKEWVHLVSEIEDWARARGCQALEISGSPGWERLMRGTGYTKCHVVLEKGL